MRLSSPLVIALIAVVAAGIYVMRDSATITADVAGYREEKTPATPGSNIWPYDRTLSVSEAYQQIPHERTRFRSDLGRMSSLEIRYLDDLFSFTDAGVVERVYIQSQMTSGALSSIEQSNYAGILDQLRSLSTPDNLLPIEALIVEATQEQLRYFQEWHEHGDPGYFSSRAPLVQSSHRKLIEAYNRLMAMYPTEDAHNKQAFYDHLCALDFI